MTIGRIPKLELSGRGALAALAAGLLTLSAPPQSRSEGVGATQSVVLADQKSRLLEAYLNSDRVATAERRDPARVAASIAEARAKLATGRTALAEGQVSQAIADFDAGMRAVAHALASSPAESARRSPASNYAARRGQVAAYLAIIRDTTGLSAADAERRAALAAALDEADALAASGNPEEAAVAIGALNANVIRFISDLKRGQTVVVRREFETAADEYAYERERNRSYKLLVRIAVAERGAAQPGLEAMAVKLGEDSERLRAQAETLADVGEHPTAIKLMERATDRLAVALRASGVLVTE